MKTRWFPLFCNISGKTVLIVGGGNIALRRVTALLSFDCQIQVVSRDFCAALGALATTHRAVLRTERRLFRVGDCALAMGKFFFVVAATNDRAVNHTVALECQEYGIPVSVADCKEESTFYFPAIVMKGPIVAGLTSGGLDHPAVRRAGMKIRAALSVKGGGDDPASWKP